MLVLSVGTVVLPQKTNKRYTYTETILTPWNDPWSAMKIIVDANLHNYPTSPAHDLPAYSYRIYAHQPPTVCTTDPAASHRPTYWLPRASMGVHTGLRVDHTPTTSRYLHLPQKQKRGLCTTYEYTEKYDRHHGTILGRDPNSN